MKFKITGAGGAPCRGNLWIEIVGSPLFKPIWLGALALFALGAWGIVVEVLSLVGGA